MKKKNAAMPIESEAASAARQPEKAKAAKKRRKPGAARRFLCALIALALLAAGGWAAWTKLTDMSTFGVTFYELQDDKITSDIRIVFLSDLHLSEFGEGNEDMAQAVARLQPDIIAIGGDMNISGNPDYQPVLTLLAKLTPIANVYYALGNHEYEEYLFGETNLIADIKASGVTLLSNHYVTVEVNGNLIDIGGLNEMSKHFEQYSQKFYTSYMQSQNYRLLLAHDPAYFTDKGLLTGEPIDLALCGHRHGGQAIVPFLGGLYFPGAGLFPDMTEGAHDVQGTWVVVSRGLGNSGDLPRVNNPPELVVIDLY